MDNNLISRNLEEAQVANLCQRGLVAGTPRIFRRYHQAADSNSDRKLKLKAMCNLTDLQ